MIIDIFLITLILCFVDKKGLLKLQEPVVTVRVRQVDQDLAKECFAPALAAYKEKTGLTTQLSLDTTRFLAAPASPSNLGASWYV